MILDMAKKSKTGGDRKRNTGEVTVISFEVDPALDAALDRCAGVERRTRRAILTIALENYLGKAGLWPPGNETA